MAKSKKRGRSSKRGRSRRGRNGKRGGRQDELADADVVTDDDGADPAAAGEGGEVEGGHSDSLQLASCRVIYILESHNIY